MTNKIKPRENFPTLVIHSTDNSFGFGYRKNNNPESDQLFIKKFENEFGKWSKCNPGMELPV